MSTVINRRRLPAVPRRRRARCGFWSRHERLVHVVASTALVWGLVYFVWRIGWSGRHVEAVPFALLLGAELFGWMSLASYAFLGWRVPNEPNVPRPAATRSVDVFVCTYDEPAWVLEATLAGCRAISHPHTTYLLDDGRRPEMRQLAERMGARWVTRTNNAHAKAGNVNHALDVTDGELILTLDADHVPLPHILDRTVGYFDDADVALVQTPHDFSNRDSFQHTKTTRHEQTLFYEVIAPGKDRHNAMFWCGSATMLRRDALQSVGGVLTDTVAEDFHTTLAMHARGWRSRYHNETLVQGLAPHDLAAFLLQRQRWARGNLAVFRTKESPLTCPGLRLKQRLSYLASLFNYFAGIQRTVLFGILAFTLVSGHLPLTATAAALAVLWLPWSVVAFISTLALARGTLGPTDSTHYGLLTMGIHTRGALSLLWRKAGQFKVTPKDGIDEGGGQVLRSLKLLTVVGSALMVAEAARLLAWTGVLSLPPLHGLALAVTLSLGAWELFFVTKVLAYTSGRHQLRRQYRFPVRLEGRIANTVVPVLDLNPEGLAFASPIEWRVGGKTQLLTRIPDARGELHDVELPLEVRSCRRVDPQNTWRVGCQLVGIDAETRSHLVDFCYVFQPAAQGGAVPAAAPPQRAPVDEQATRPVGQAG